jgi:hypothetical protein
MRCEDGSLAFRSIQREFFNFSDCCHEEKYNAWHYESKRCFCLMGLRLQRICAPHLEQFDRQLREHRLLRTMVFPSSSRCARFQADSSPARGGLSVIGRNAGFEFALSAPFVV